MSDRIPYSTMAAVKISGVRAQRVVLVSPVWGKDVHVSIIAGIERGTQWRARTVQVAGKRQSELRHELMQLAKGELDYLADAAVIAGQRIERTAIYLDGMNTTFPLSDGWDEELAVMKLHGLVTSELEDGEEGWKYTAYLTADRTLDFDRDEWPNVKEWREAHETLVERLNYELNELGLNPFREWGGYEDFSPTGKMYARVHVRQHGRRWLVVMTVRRDT